MHAEGQTKRPLHLVPAQEASVPELPAPASRADALTIPMREHEYRRMRNLVQRHFGLHLTTEKKTLIMNRLHTYVSSQGFASYGAYIDHVEADSTGVALDNLASLMSTNHTAFFREEAHFVALQTQVLPDIDDQLQRRRDHDLRLWCAAASTGEEAYSIMMTLLEYFGARYTSLDAGLLATDISLKALHKAAKGVYSAEQVKAIPAAWRERYVTQLDAQHYAVHALLRAEVVFRKFNLMTAHYPFKKPFHIIFLSQCDDLFRCADASHTGPEAL